MKKYLTTILLLFLAGFLAWLLFIPFMNPPIAPVAASPITRLLTGTPATTMSVDNSPIVELRRTLGKELAVVKFKVQKVASAIDTLRSAESVFVGLSVKAQPDRANLGPALEDVRAALSSTKIDGVAGNLLDPATLNHVVKSLTQDIEQIELKQGDPALPTEQLVALQDQLPGLLDRHKVDPLPTKLVRLENAVRETLGAKLDSTTTFIARYDRGADQLVYEQETTLRFNGSQPRSLDLSNFFLGTQRNFRETVTIQRNEATPELVLPKDRVIALPIGTNFVAVKLSITRSNASHPILNSHYVLSFRAIEVHWPSSSFPAIIANIRLPENPDRTWPWTIDTGSGSDFRGVEIPQYSFIYSTPAGTLLDQRNSSLVTFKDEKLTPQALATSSQISLEFLPRWLSFDTVQKNKNYLVTENGLFALIAGALSTCATIFLRKS